MDKGIYLHPIKQIYKSKYFGKPFFLYKNIIINKIKEINPDAIYHRGLSAFLGIAAEFKMEQNYKLFWHVASKWDVIKKSAFDNPNFITSYFNNRLIKIGIENSDLIFIQEKNHKNKLIENYYINSKIVLVNKFLEKFKYRKRNNKKINIIWVANIKPVKQLELYIEIAEKINNNFKYNFIIVGNLTRGSYQNNLSNRIKKSNYVKYLGAMSFYETCRLIGSSDILINTSILEGGPPVSFLQAWMSRTLILSLNVNPDSLFSKFNLGFYFNNDLDNMINFIHTYDINKFDDLLNKANNFVSEKYSLENIKIIKQEMEKLIF